MGVAARLAVPVAVVAAAGLCRHASLLPVGVVVPLVPRSRPPLPLFLLSPRCRPVVDVPLAGAGAGWGLG